ncbi:MAG: hypothetical protein ACPL1G_03485 [Thermodesulfovibrionales bacterium]
MPQLNIKIKDTEIISLVEQLPKKKKQVLLKKLIIEDMPDLEKISGIGRKRFLAFCKKRGINPVLLSEEDKERLVDKVLHEAN